MKTKKKKGIRFFVLEKILKKKIEQRTQWITNVVDKFIQEDGKLLDIGSGGGFVAEEIKKRKKSQITLLDVVNFDYTDSKVVLYDGRNMPFEKDHFDDSLLIFVLHHSENLEQVLKEAKRVTNGKILILEDTYSSIIGKAMLILEDTLTNLPVFLLHPFKENMLFKFKSIKKWKETFNDLGLSLISEENYERGKFMKNNRFFSLFVVKPVKSQILSKTETY